MAKVGSDKRLNYYQQSVEQVLEEVRSHAYGLTNPEAARRVEHNGFNRLPTVNDQNWSKLVVEQAQTPTVLLLVICLIISWYLGMTATAWGSLIIALLVVVAGTRRELRTTNITYHLDKYLPEKVTVRRNDKQLTIDAFQLALGDIVLLGPGDIVPADLRIIESEGLHTDDSLLFGSGQAHKHTHALKRAVPLAQRHNLAFMGATVASGSGAGVVVATAGQTELGRLLHLSSTTTSHRSLFSNHFHRQSKTLGLAAAGLSFAIIITAMWAGLSKHNGLLALQALLAGIAPAGIALTAPLVFAQFRKLSQRRGIHVESLAAVDRLANLDVLFLDEVGLVTGRTPLARGFLIGKRQFTNPAESLDPTIRLHGPAGRKLGTETIKELDLFFDAIALSTHSIVLPPDSDTPHWHISGSATAGALVSLVAQAGRDSQSCRHEHSLLRDFPYDADRNISSSIRHYDHRDIVFANGDAGSLLKLSTKVWDGGHTRKLTNADHKRFSDYIEAQTKLGNSVAAVAYRPLAAKESAAKLSLKAAETDLILLGLVAIGRPLKHSAVLAAASAQAKGIAVSILGSNSQAVSVAICRQLGLDDNLRVLSGSDVDQLDNGRLAELVSASNALFMHLSPEQRLRLIDASEQAGLRTLISGQSLADVPAMRHATIGAGLSSASAMVQAEADIVSLDDDAHAVTRAHGRAVQTTEHLTESIWAALTNHATAVWLILLGVAEMVAWHVPLAVTALQLLLLGAVLQLLPAVALGRDKSHRKFASEDSAAQLAYHSNWSGVALGLIAALLIATNFLYFFNRLGLSPSYIDSSSHLYAQAATLSLATLALCGWINIVFVRAEKLPLLTSRQLWHNRTLTWSLVISLLLLLGLVYLPLLQDFAGTQPLTVGDWLTALLVAVVYAGVRYIAHAERQHSRHAIVQLHHEIHGPDSPAKV